MHIISPQMTGHPVNAFIFVAGVRAPCRCWQCFFTLANFFAKVLAKPLYFFYIRVPGYMTILHGPMKSMVVNHQFQKSLNTYLLHQLFIARHQITRFLKLVHQITRFLKLVIIYSQAPNYTLFEIGGNYRRDCKSY